MAEGLRITFAFNPDAPFFDRVFTRFTEHVSDLTTAFREIAAQFYEGERAQFASQGGYGGRPWAPLSPAYALWKAQHFPNKGILRRTDQLFAAATGDTSAGAILDVRPMEMRIGIDPGSAVAARARFHQGGTSRMPARPFLVITEAMKRDWTRVIVKRVTEAAKEAAAAINARSL